jgi:O-antigen/teichoic acid export membrane protein
MEWWGVGASLVGPFVPLTAVILGYSLKIAGFGVAAWVFVYAVVLFADMLRLLRRSEITWVKPDRHRMLRSFTRSLAVTVRMILDMARQQGTSLLLAPLVGAAQMAVFATMRTGANVTKQGLATITNPLMPELMRFLAQRDQARSEAAFAMVWLVVCAVMGPAVLVLQCVAPELFTWWTLGKMAFDGWLLGTLSLGVLVFGAAQPAFAVVQGNNLLRTQLIVSVLSGVIAVAGLVLLVPRMGIRGAAIALLAAEIAALLVCRRFAGIWLEQQGMYWPKRGYRRVLTSVLLAGVGMVAITAWPAMAWLWVIVCGLGMGCCLISYISCLPLLVRQQFAHRLSNLPIVGALLQIK